MKKINCLIFIIEFLLIAIGILKTPAWGDEVRFHAPPAQNIAWQKIVAADSDYYGAYTPLPYIIGNLFYRIIVFIDSDLNEICIFSRDQKDMLGCTEMRELGASEKAFLS